ncbi:MAG TPA: hypothetical protein PKO16_01295 [Bacteroidia bacterium]|nr:hypothetical protein [Bacteroidia bacterium]
MIRNRKLVVSSSPKHLLFVVSFFLLYSISQAQNWIVPVDGKVMVAGQKTTGAVVTLFKNGQQQQQVVTTSNGRFGFELAPNAEYIIAVTKPGFITKKFKIVTSNVPADRAAEGDFNPFEPDVSLFEMPSAIEIAKRVEAILSQPIAIYQFIPSENNFNYDQKYTDAIQSKLAELADMQKEVEKEMQVKAKKVAVEAQQQLETDNKYKAAIAKADKSFSGADYTSAKTGYNEALAIKSQEAYPKQKIAEIDKLLANTAQKEIDEKYKAAIAKADKSFSGADYPSAKTGYNEALAIKAQEAYPKQKIIEIDKLLANANAQKEVEEKYKTAIAKGDKAFSGADYSSAKAGYNEALSIKSQEAYPKQKIAEIDKLLNDLASKKSSAELDQKYNTAIAKADKAFLSKDYLTAKSSYTEALGVKPSEAYPKSKLGEIDKLMTNVNTQKDVDGKYKIAIATGDKFFSEKNYTSAQTSYMDASSIKPNEQYPKQKLLEIDKLLASLEVVNQKELRYKELVDKADKQFVAKDYFNSKNTYSQALVIKQDAYPKQKIEEIDKILKDQQSEAAIKQLEKNYQDAIVKGDAAFKQKIYANAKTAYKDALTYKPDEKYPQSKLDEIARIEKDNVSTLAANDVQAKYNQCIERADKSFTIKDYVNAKSGYTEALTYKPNEKYPKQRLAQIDALTKAPIVQQTPVITEPKPIVTTQLTDEEKKKSYQSEIRLKYPLGVTEEEFTSNGKTILRRVVVREDFAAVYLRVTHNWGGVYCFKDNLPVPENVFDNETK